MKLFWYFKALIYPAVVSCRLFWLFVMIKVSSFYQRLTSVVGIDYRQCLNAEGFFSFMFYCTVALCLMDSFLMVFDIVILLSRRAVWCDQSVRSGTSIDIAIAWFSSRVCFDFNFPFPSCFPVKISSLVKLTNIFQLSTGNSELQYTAIWTVCTIKKLRYFKVYCIWLIIGQNFNVIYYMFIWLQ